MKFGRSISFPQALAAWGLFCLSLSVTLAVWSWETLRGREAQRQHLETEAVRVRQDVQRCLDA